MPHAQRSYKETARDGAGRPQELEVQIRERTYALYEERGREDGRDLEDWLHAEEEIMEKKRPIAA